MTEEELRDYQMWTYEDLAEYLLKAVYFHFFLISKCFRGK